MKIFSHEKLTFLSVDRTGDLEIVQTDDLSIY